MKRILLFIVISLYGIVAYSQRQIKKAELDLLKNAAIEHKLLQDSVTGFDKKSIPSTWQNEPAIILNQSAVFVFDKNETAEKKKAKTAAGKLEDSLVQKENVLSFTDDKEAKRIYTEEIQQRKILLQDAAAVSEFATLYFRLSKADAFAARIIKQDGSIKNVELDSAMQVLDLRTIPDFFKSYTARQFSVTYQPAYFRITIPDLAVGDILEYAFVNLNMQTLAGKNAYEYFDPVYYVAKTNYPILKQQLSVTPGDKHLNFVSKNINGAPAFSANTKNKKKSYTWEYSNTEKLTDTKFINALQELPAVKFQLYSGYKNGWFPKSKNIQSPDINSSEVENKIKESWSAKSYEHSKGYFSAGLPGNIHETSKKMYADLKKNYVTNNTNEEYARKAYYMIRSQTLHNNWSDYAFAKVFTALLSKKKLPYDVYVTTANSITSFQQIAFPNELCWIVKYGDNYFINPARHGNPNEFSQCFAGNTAIHFKGGKTISGLDTDSLPGTDTARNVLLTEIRAELDTAGRSVMRIDKTMIAKGCARENIIDETLTYTPFVEQDYKFYDGDGTWEGFQASKDEEQSIKVTEALLKAEREWKNEKISLMSAEAKTDYDVNVFKYGSIRVFEDGRNYKKPDLKFVQNFTVGNLTTPSGNDIIVKLPALMGAQIKISDAERTRTLPVDLGYPRIIKWQIGFKIPFGYKPIDLDSLNTDVFNDYASFSTRAHATSANVVEIDITETFNQKHLDAEQWPQLVAVLDAAYNFSRREITFIKK